MKNFIKMPNGPTVLIRFLLAIIFSIALVPSFSEAAADWMADGEVDNGQFGFRVSGAGDVNNDGYQDVIVGSPYQHTAYVYHGSASGLSNSPDWTYTVSYFAFGSYVASAGDVNGDNYDDVIVGAFYYTSPFTTDPLLQKEGAAFVFYGSPDGLSSAPDWSVESNVPGSEFGVSVCSAGDVNGDGLSDIAVGAWQYEGKGAVFVYYGDPNGLSDTANWSAYGDQEGAEFGVAVSTAGDVNDDGYDDLIIGAWKYDDGQTDEGKAFVYHGSSEGLETTPNWTAQIDQAYAYFGASHVSCAGDVNKDGYDDVLIGAGGYSNPEANEGASFVYLGSDVGLEATYHWQGESNQANAAKETGMGGFTNGAGDLNGDGYSDVVIGVSAYDVLFPDEGVVLAYLGSEDGLSNFDWNYLGGQASCDFGYHVDGAGDVNGDGFDDIIIGAPLYDSADLTDNGRVFVYYGHKKCTYSISALSQQHDSSEVTGASISIIASSEDCAWTAEVEAPADSWLTITSGENYRGDGTVIYNVAANKETVSRSGTILIAGNTFTVEQKAGPLWIDNFDGDTPDQSWLYRDSFDDPGDSITYDFINGRFEFTATSSTGPEDKHLTAGVDSYGEIGDAILQAKLQAISPTDHFFANLALRLDPATETGYGFGINSMGYIFIGERINGVGQPMKIKQVSFDPTTTDCYLKFAAVGQKLFGKAWPVGAPEPNSWQIELIDDDQTCTSGYAGVGVFTWPINEFYCQSSRAAFDGVRLFTDLSYFSEDTATSSGTELSANSVASLSAGESEITVESQSDQDHVISVEECSDTPPNNDQGLFSTPLIAKHLNIDSSLTDGEHQTTVKLYYTDTEIAGINEIDLRLYYYDDISQAWLLAVDGNTTGSTSWKGNSAPTAALGDHGVDMANNIVWAVVDHFTAFGIGGTGSGGWALQDNNLMLQGDSSQAQTTVTIPAGGSYTWIAGAPATSNTQFSPNYDGQLSFSAAVGDTVVGNEFSIAVGWWDGAFNSGDTGGIAADGSAVYDDLVNYFANTTTFTINAGDYLAFQVTNNTAAAQTILTGGLRSWLNAININPSTYPTLVTLTSFTASATESGIELSWHTESEVENAGFHIWRSTEEDGDYTRVTSSLIPATGSETQPSDYSYTDYSANGGQIYYYKLEDISNAGVSTLHGPVSVGDSSAELANDSNSAEETAESDNDNDSCFINTLMGR